MWRFQPLHPATFLIDQDRGVVSAKRQTNIHAQGAYLFRGSAITGKKNCAPRLFLLKKIALARVKGFAGTSADKSSGVHLLRATVKPCGLNWRDDAAAFAACFQIVAQPVGRRLARQGTDAHPVKYTPAGQISALYH